MKITLTGNDKQNDKSYDKIFSIIDKEVFIVKCEPTTENQTEKGYELNFDCSIPQSSIEKIENLKNVKIEY